MSFVDALALLIVVAAGASALPAQEHHGGGISSSAGGLTSVAYIREEWGPPDSVRLAAAVIWRGTSPWGVTTSPAEDAASRASADSAQAASRSHHRLGGGTITPHGEAWVEFDPRERAVYVRGERFPIPYRDSVFVILIDDTTPITDATHIRTRELAGVAEPDLVRAAMRSGSGFAEASMARQQAWSAALEADAVVSKFLGSGSR